MFRPYFEAPRTVKNDVMKYADHIKKVKRAENKMNNSAPLLPSDTYLKEGNLDFDARRLGEVENENRNLIQRLNIVGRTKGKIDFERPIPAIITNFRKRQLEKMAIERRNEEMYREIENTVKPHHTYLHMRGKHKTDELLKNFEAEQKVESSRSLEFDERKEQAHWTIAPNNIDTSLLHPKHRVKCYFDIAVKGGIKLGRIDFEIWMDIAPVAGCNFLNLCRGYEGYSYKNTPIHNIFKGLFCIGGDVINQSGTGVYSVYGGQNSTFGDENNILQFKGRGVLATHTVFAGDNHSQFLITFQKLMTMNKHFVVFGRAIGNLRVLELIERYGNEIGKPMNPIIITHCGVKGFPPAIEPIHFMGELPAKIDFEDDEDVKTIGDYERVCEASKDIYDMDSNIRRGLIKRSREEMKEAGFPIYKMDMPFTKKKINCTKLFKKHAKI